MGYPVTMKFSFEVKDGPTIKPSKDHMLMIDAYMPISTEIKNDKQWHLVRIDAGSKEFVKFMVIDSDIYEPESCPPNGHALYMEFLDKDQAGDPNLKTRPVTDAIKIMGPQIFLGQTLDLLPEELVAVRFKNTLPKPAQVRLTIGKLAYIPNKEDEMAKPRPQ
jgi:hypothetical protein